MNIVKKFNEWVNEEWVSSNTIDNGEPDANIVRKNIIRDVFKSLKKHYAAQYFEQPIVADFNDDETYIWWSFNTDIDSLLDGEREQVYGKFFLKEPATIDWITEDYKLKFYSFAVTYNTTINGEKIADAVIELDEFDEENNEDGDIQRLEYYTENDTWQWTANKDGELDPSELGETNSVNIQAVIVSITEVLNPKSKYLNNFFIS